MRCAALDVGSNSVVLLVADQLGGERFDTVEDLAVITRLGQGLDQGRLTPEAIGRTVQAVAELVARARELGAREIAAVGTQALREAVNAPQLIQQLQHELGLLVRVIGGDEEARLSYLAARSSLDLQPRPVAVLDVGGGSTELILGTPERMARRQSVRLGALTLTERWLRSDPVQPAELTRLREQVGRELSGLEPGAQVVGIGGAVTTLAAVQLELEPYDPDRVHGAALTLEEVRRQQALYLGLPVAERRELPGLHPGRADTILAGAVIVERVLLGLQADRLTVCDRGLRHGLMIDRFGL